MLAVCKRLKTHFGYVFWIYIWTVGTINVPLTNRSSSLHLVSYVRSSESYFLNYDLDTNLPEQFSDPIDENWQDKRSVGNEHSSLFKRHFLFPKAYRGSTLAHDEVGGSELQKRESEMERNDEVEEKFDDTDSDFKNSFHEADARQILSKFSNSDREALNSLMNDEGPYIDVDKRQSLKQNFENSYHLNKRNNFKVPCKGLECENDDQNSVLSEDDGYNYCPEKVIAKRKPKFKRSSHFRSTPRENILQAKISILKDNYKRSSEMRSLEDSANRRYSENKRNQENDRQPGNKLMN